MTGPVRWRAAPVTAPDCRLRTEARGDRGELPVALCDAAAAGVHRLTGAAPVPVDAPECHPRQVILGGEVTDLGPGRGRGQLRLVAQTVHAGDAAVGVRRRLA